MARSVAFRNADDLFAQLSVRDVDQVLARTTRDADAKRDELKTLVSSRYHDLIDSADAIVGMTATVANFQDLVRDVESRAQHLLRDRPSLINISVSGDSSSSRKPPNVTTNNATTVKSTLSSSSTTSAASWLANDSSNVLQTAVAAASRDDDDDGDAALRLDADRVNALMLLPTHVWTSVDAHHMWHAAFLFHVALALTETVKAQGEESKVQTTTTSQQIAAVGDSDNDDMFSWFGMPAESVAQLTTFRQAAATRSKSMMQVINNATNAIPQNKTTLWHRFPLLRSQCQLVRDMRNRVAAKARSTLSDGSLSLLSCAGAVAAFVSLHAEGRLAHIDACRELLAQRVGLLKSVVRRLSTSPQRLHKGGDSSDDTNASFKVAILCTALRCVQQSVHHAIGCFGPLFAATHCASLVEQMLSLSLSDAVQRLENVPVRQVRDVSVLVGPFQNRKLREMMSGNNSDTTAGASNDDIVALVRAYLHDDVVTCLNEAIESVLQSVNTVEELVQLRKSLVACEIEGQRKSVEHLTAACAIIEEHGSGASQVESALHSFGDLCNRVFLTSDSSANVGDDHAVFSCVFQPAVVARMSSMLRDSFAKVCADTKNAIMALTQDPDTETRLKRLVIKVKREQMMVGGGRGVQDTAMVEDLAAAHLDSILPLYPAEDGTLSVLDLAVRLGTQLQAVYMSALTLGADDSGMADGESKEGSHGDSHGESAEGGDGGLLAKMMRHGDAAVVDALQDRCLEAFGDLVDWLCQHTETKASSFYLGSISSSSSVQPEEPTASSGQQTAATSAADVVSVMQMVEIRFREQLAIEQGLLAARVCQALASCDVTMLKSEKSAATMAKAKAMVTLQERLRVTATAVYDGWVAHVVDGAVKQVREQMKSEQWDLGEQMWNELHSGTCRLVRVSDRDEDEEDNEDDDNDDADENDLIMVPSAISHHVLAFVHKLCQAVRCVGDAQFTTRVRLAIDDRKAANKGNTADRGDDFNIQIGGSCSDIGDLDGGSGVRTTKARRVLDEQTEAVTTAACLDCFGGFSQRASRLLADRALRSYTDAIAGVLGVRLEDQADQTMPEEESNTDISHVSQPAALRALLDLMWIQVQLAPAAMPRTVERVEKTVETVVDDVIEPLWCLYRPALDLALVECLEGTHLLAGPLLLLHPPGQATDVQRLLKEAHQREQQRVRGTAAAAGPTGPVWASREDEGQSSHVTLMPLATPIPRIGLLPVATPFKPQSQRLVSTSAANTDRRNSSRVAVAAAAKSRSGETASVAATNAAAGSVSDKAFAAMGGLGSGLSHWLQG
jgi:hypothetical protein